MSITPLLWLSPAVSAVVILNDARAGGVLGFVLVWGRLFVARLLLFDFGFYFAVFGIDHDRKIDRRQFADILGDDGGFWRLAASGGFRGWSLSFCIGKRLI